MRINKTKSKNMEHYSIIQDITKNGKRTTKVYENIGNLEKLKQRAENEEPLKWLENYVRELNKREKENKAPVIIRKDPSKMIDKNVQSSFNVGYLFLQDIYYKLKLNKICDKITEKYQFKFDLNDILSKLIYSSILFPASKLKTLELSKKFLEQPNFDYQHIERALPIICENIDFIQSELYKNSNEYMERNNKIMYYDRKFVTTQSIKKLKTHLKNDALDLTKGWKVAGSSKTYNISKLRTDEKLIAKYRDTIFYKERWLKENSLEQRLIIAYSVKYQEYQKNYC